MISQKLNTFNTYLLTLITYLAANSIRLRIPVAQMTKISNMGAVWTPLWNKYSSPSTHTTGSVDDINAEYDIVHGYTEKLKLQLKFDLNVELLGDDYSVIEIHEDLDKRGEIPAYGFSPSGKIVRQGHLLATVNVSSTEEGHENDGHIPTDVARIGMKMIVQGADLAAPVSSALLPHPSSSEVKVDFAFAAGDVGKAAYVIFWYENPKGDNRSPESEMLKITII